ncbi:DUF805 domain-containing protein [Gelidibacter sp. F2691]|nr:DUF805 domain-containing protein [Gelidibacter sp. F2691]
MDFQTAVRTCFQKYVTFSGRAARSEYWWYTLFIIVASIVLGLVDGTIFGWGELFSPLSDLFSLATLLPSLAVTSRRLHDYDKSAWWMLLILIPIIGWIVLIYWMCQKGTDGPNQYGNDPLGGAIDHHDDGDYATSSIPPSGS